MTTQLKSNQCIVGRSSSNNDFYGKNSNLIKIEIRSKPHRRCRSLTEAFGRFVSRNNGCGADDDRHHTFTKQQQPPCPITKRMDSSSSSSSSEATTTKSVSFSTVTIQEHARILGDNPACHDGLPLGIDWKHSHAKVVDVDVHENQQLDRNIGRSGRRVRKLDALERKVLLHTVAGIPQRRLVKAYRNAKSGSSPCRM